jgi:lipoprotein-anchoring transpeptidase ErfK/SrfK
MKKIGFRWLGLWVLLVAISPVGAHVVGIPASPENKSAGVSLEEIEANPTPNVQEIPQADENLYNRAYRRIVSNMQLYDAPNGNLVADWGKGFNFITAARQQDGFTFIGGGRWVRTDTLSNRVNISRFAGVLLPAEPLLYTAAWVVQEVRPSINPGEPEAPAYAPLERYTRVNLFTYVEIDGKRWYQIADRQWIHQYNVSKIQPVAKPAEIQSHKWVSIDLYEQNMIAYEGATPVYATLVSSGLPQWSTPEGIFHVYLRADRVVMSGSQGKPDFYYLQDVPYNMFFKDDVALHGTYWHDRFGFRTSHGCVNLTMADAQWLYNWSADESDPDNRADLGIGVYVYSSGTYD